MAVLCTKQVPSLCEAKATEILYVREAGGQVWDEYPRCPEHPAAGDAAMVKRIFPDAEIRIERLETGDTR